MAVFHRIARLRLKIFYEYEEEYTTNDRKRHLLLPGSIYGRRGEVVVGADLSVRPKVREPRVKYMNL